MMLIKKRGQIDGTSVNSYNPLKRKRKRKKKSEIIRNFKCDSKGCGKAYGLFNKF